MTNQINVDTYTEKTHNINNNKGGESRGNTGEWTESKNTQTYGAENFEIHGEWELAETDSLTSSTMKLVLFYKANNF